MTTSVTLVDLCKTFGRFDAVKSLSMVVERGELVALLGPSGCGKTTTLRMIAGFLDATKGMIKFGDRDVTKVAAKNRNAGMVFQGYALFPHLTVNQNVAFGLEMRGVSKSSISDRVKETLRLVRLDHLADRLPSQLSGGQQQRVALARAMVIRPDVLLLDEPLSALDAKLRETVRHEIKTLQSSLGQTTIMVTHDQEEALAMSDRIVIMNDGAIEQIGTPNEIYEAPQSRFVANFVGRCNFLAGSYRGGDVFVLRDGTEMRCKQTEGLSTGPASLGIRPEDLTIVPATGSALKGRIRTITYLGTSLSVDVQTNDSQVISCSLSPTAFGSLGLRQGDEVGIEWAGAKARLYAESAGTPSES